MFCNTMIAENTSNVALPFAAAFHYSMNILPFKNVLHWLSSSDPHMNLVIWDPPSNSQGHARARTHNSPLRSLKILLMGVRGSSSAEQRMK